MSLLIKKISIISLFFILHSCSSKINEHFEQNRYIRNYNIHIMNDSLQLYLKTPSDITYSTNKKELKKIIRNGKIKIVDSVLVYGKTNDPPYEYFVTISKKNSQSYPKEFVVYDTVINQKIIKFIGNSLSANSKRTLEIDLYKIFKSLEVGSTYRKQISTVFDIVNKYKSSNKFYAALCEIKNYPAYDKEEEWTKLQMELTFSSFLGDNEFYVTHLDKLETKIKLNKNISEIIRKNTVSNSLVIDTILKEAKKHKIVMINENHYYPNQRLLVTDLLQELKKIGYKYIALEALGTKQDSLLNSVNSYPTLDTGFYTSEQNYANLIRKAIELEFEFVAYENIDSNKNREIAQAENLYNKTFKINPNSKVVVLAGIDHILEKTTSEGKEWMATVFKNKYSIDPLTISQTHLNSYRKQINSKYGIISSKFFENEKLNSVDYLVLNNSPNIQLEDITAFHPYKNNTENDVQIALFFGNEITNSYDYHKKVPYYTTILKSGKKTELPICEKKELHLYILDKNGKMIEKQIIKPSNNSHR